MAGMPPRSGSTPALFVLAAAPAVAKVVSQALFSQNYLAQSAYKLLQLAAPVGWRSAAEGRRGLRSLWPVEEPLPSRGVWLSAAALSAGTIALAIVLLPLVAAWLGLQPAALRAHFDREFGLHPWAALVIVAFLSTLNAALEELHFRHWLDGQLSARYGDRVGIGVSAVAFGGMHAFIFARLPGVTMVVLALVTLGLAAVGASWSLLCRRPGGIHAAWFAHAVTDAGFLTWGLWWLGYFSSSGNS